MPAPLPMVAPPDGDRDRGPMMLGVIWTMGVISVLITAARFYIRFVRRSIGVDDWCMLLALCFFLPTLAVITKIESYGLGRHIFYVPRENYVPFLKWVFILQSFTFFTLAFAKASISLLLVNLLGPNAKWTKRFIWTNVFLFFLFTILTTIFNLAACRPLKASWEPVTGAKCWPLTINQNWAIFITVYSSFLDFVLALLPVTIVWRLQVSLQKKMGLSFLLGLGILAGSAAALKASELSTLANRSDFSFEAIPLYIWSTLEFFLNIFCGCVPTLKPLYDQLCKGKPMQPSEGSAASRYLFFAGILRSDRFFIKNWSKDSASTGNGVGSGKHHHLGSRSSGEDSKQRITVKHSIDVGSYPKGNVSRESTVQTFAREEV